MVPLELAELQGGADWAEHTGWKLNTFAIQKKIRIQPSLRSQSKYYRQNKIRAKYFLIKSLEKRFNKKIEGKVEINKSIIGGTKIIVGDTVIDASVRGQLDNLAYKLKA